MTDNIQLLNYLKNIQQSAKKKVKRATYNDLLLYLNETELKEKDIDILFSGNENLKIEGILELCGKKNQSGLFKKSSRDLLKIVHDILIFSKQSERYSKEFVLYDDFIKSMNLSEHFKESKQLKDKDYKNQVIHIVKTIKIVRPQFNLEDALDSTTIKEITEEVDKLIAKYHNQKTINTNIYQEVMQEIKEVINLEPKTWDDVLKIKNKKLLTTEFISLSNNNKDSGTFIDEEKEAEKELINNFLDPLTPDNLKLNINDFSDEDRSKLHLQYDTFDNVFFLEKFYSKSTLTQFQCSLSNLQGNLKKISKDDENLVDNNIYKYLDCKKILDEILFKFKSTTSNNLNKFREYLFDLKNKIKLLLDPIKQKHINYKKSKSSMEIIQKFQKYFVMKEKIEHCLKFSNFEDLAELLKKINIEVKEISQNKFIYGEFYEFFIKTIENFKKVLNNIISQSSVREIIEKHFKLLLDFDIEVEAVDDILNTLKEKMSNKIENYLEFTDNFEIKNFKEFFCDEFHLEIYSEKIYSSLMKEADQYVKENTKDKTQDFNKLDSNPIDANFLNDYNEEYKKKNLINVETIVQSLYDDVKDFLIMMKTLDDSISLKINRKNYSGTSQIKSIFQEIYHYLFQKLISFLFLDNNDMEKKITDNYLNLLNKIKENKNYKFSEYYDSSFDSAVKILEYYQGSPEISTIRFNDNFNKNTLQNISNILLDLFDLFEIYILKENFDSLYDPRKIIVEKIFFAFLNEKIILLLNYFVNENSIEFMDTSLTISNTCGFTFSKNFLSLLFKSFKNIKKFYINILKKTNEGVVKYDIVYLAFFSVLKSFYLKFLHFYETEFYMTEDYRRLNGLILEILKNYLFLKYEILIIVKSLFKNIDGDLQYKLNDLNCLGDSLQNLFVDQYIKNESVIIFNLFTSNFEYSKNYINFYEKYDSLLISLEYQEAKKFFVDIRSVVVEIIFHIAVFIKEFFELDIEFLNKEEYGSNANDKIKILINNSLFYFFEKLIEYLKQNKENFLNDNRILLIYQIYFELAFINLFMEDIIKKIDITYLKYKELIKIVFDIIVEFKVINKIFLEPPELIEESVLFSKEELFKKKKVLEDYSSKYYNYTKCFKI